MKSALRDWLAECVPGRSAEPPIVPRSGAAAALTTLAALAMSFLAVLTVAAGLAADRLASSWRSDLGGAATVRVIAPKAEMEARITDALVVLSSAPGVASARLLTDAELRALIEPWLRLARRPAGAAIDRRAPRRARPGREGAAGAA